MSQRGRNYYDPILQVPASIEGEANKERIEVFPVGMDSPSRLPSEVGKWASRRVASDGRVIEQGPSAGEQGEAIRQAEMNWPGLEVYFVTAEIEDSTWDGVGPSPRLWHTAADVTPAVGMPGRRLPELPDSAYPPGAKEIPVEVMPNPDVRSITAIVATKSGAYIHIEDVVLLLEDYAQQYDDQGNPSGALALREAASALKEPF